MRMRLGTLKRIIREAVEAELQKSATNYSSPSMIIDRFQYSNNIDPKTKFMEVLQDLKDAIDANNSGTLEDWANDLKSTMGSYRYQQDLANSVALTDSENDKDRNVAMIALVAMKHSLTNSDVRVFEKDILAGLTPENAEQAFEDALARRAAYAGAHPPGSSGGPGQGTRMVGTSGTRTLD